MIQEMKKEKRDPDPSLRMEHGIRRSLWGRRKLTTPFALDGMSKRGPGDAS